MAAAKRPVVLIVDDEPSVRLFLRKAVERCGFTSLIAATASEARQLILSEHFDCAMVDKNLPDGSGIELLELIKQERPQADVVIVTGYVNSQSAIEALRLGAVDYICKPFDFDTVEHRLKAVMERRNSLEERARLESMLVHADRLSSLGAMAAGVVHEINNPLAFVTSNASFLEEELAELIPLASPELRPRLQACAEAARDARDGIKRVATIVKDLRTFSRKDDPVPEIVDLEDCAEAALVVAGPSVKDKVKVERKYTPSHPVRISASRLEQVFLNLVVNAAQAITASGRVDGLVTITTSSTTSGEAVVEIADNGSGMSVDVQRRLFEPFFTTKPKNIGTGLGLAVCHGIVSAAGGRIDVRSEQGVGTVFRLTFPGVIEKPEQALQTKVA